MMCCLVPFPVRTESEIVSLIWLISNTHIRQLKWEQLEKKKKKIPFAAISWELHLMYNVITVVVVDGDSDAFYCILMACSACAIE